ncbi:MAG: hypothetical protein H0W96_07010 [Solirubrobacterales bacterium]|nr:hypothetical protein [Solirubrobacterales bacterium]
MSARNSLLLGIVATIAAIAALWVLVLAPKREQAAQLGSRVALAEQARDAALNRARTAEAARAGYERDYATVARLGKAVPENADVPSLVFQLEAAARKAKVDFRSVSVLDPPATPTSGAPTAGGGIQPSPFSLKFEGGFFELQKLLSRVDRFSRVKGTQISVNGRLLTIDGVTLSPAPGGLPRMQGIVTARAYVADLPAVLPSAGTRPAGLAGQAATATPASEVTP